MSGREKEREREREIERKRDRETERKRDSPDGVGNAVEHEFKLLALSSTEKWDHTVDASLALFFIWKLQTNSID